MATITQLLRTPQIPKIIIIARRAAIVHSFNNYLIN